MAPKDPGKLESWRFFMLFTVDPHPLVAVGVTLIGKASRGCGGCGVYGICVTCVGSGAMGARCWNMLRKVG